MTENPEPFVIPESSPPTEPRSSSAWAVSLVLIALIVCGAPIICVATGVGGIGGVFQPFQNLFQNIGRAFDPSTSAEVTSTQTLVSGIQPLGQLVSMSLQVAKADVQVNVRSGLGNACGYSANHVVQGTVEAGIDLSAVSDNNILYNAETDTYTLTLPAAQLTSCRIDWIRQYDQSTTACSSDWDAARIIAGYDTLNAFRKDAVEGGVLDRAQRQADLVISQFVRSLTGAEVVIKFSAENATNLPASCVPQAPAGWSYNAEYDQWQQD